MTDHIIRKGFWTVVDDKTRKIVSQNDCQHDWKEMSTGSTKFVNGDVADDTHDYLWCPLCGAEIDQLPADVLEETEIPF